MCANREEPKCTPSRVVGCAEMPDVIDLRLAPVTGHFRGRVLRERAHAPGPVGVGSTDVRHRRRLADQRFRSAFRLAEPGLTLGRRRGQPRGRPLRHLRSAAGGVVPAPHSDLHPVAAMQDVTQRLAHHGWVRGS